MLKKVRIKNFRGIQDSGEIDFMPGITILVGQNESGKTSILEAINDFGKFFRYIVMPPETEYFNINAIYPSKRIKTAEFTFSTNEQFQQKLKKLVKEKINSKDKKMQEKRLFNWKNLKKIKEYKIFVHKYPKHNNNQITFDIDNNTFYLFLKIIKRKEEKDNQLETIKTILTKEELAKLIWLSSPKIILFNLKDKLLPDEIPIRVLKGDIFAWEGYYGVKNLEKQMKIDFCKIVQKTDAQKKILINNLSKKISVNFRKAWKQKIHTGNEIKIKIDIRKDKEGSEFVQFYVSSKEDQYFPPKKSSAGMIWFLSFWLEMMAHKNSKEKLILLFDEPSNSLHNIGCEDVLNVFKELTKKNHQIIFDTHRSNLITKKFQRLRIVVNDEKKGIIVESISKLNVNNQNIRAAFDPIIVKMGINPDKEMGVFSEKSVILEGMSDYLYFEGMRHILKRDNTYKFVPGVGVKYERVMSLISFCIGYEIKFVVILDNEPCAKQIEKTLKKEIPNIIENKIIFLPKRDIKEMFSVEDLKLINPQMNIKKNKIIYAAKFLTKAINDEINKTNLDPKTIKIFESIFSDLEKKLKENN